MATQGELLKLHIFIKRVAAKDSRHQISAQRAVLEKRGRRRGQAHRHLIRQHVAIVVVGRHAEAAVRPPDNLHRGGVGDEVAQHAPRAFQEAGVQVWS